MQNKEKADRFCIKVLNPEIYKHGISKPVQKFTFLFTINLLLSPLGGFFFKHFFVGGGGGLFNLVKRINGSKVSHGRTCGSRALYLLFLTIRKLEQFSTENWSVKLKKLSTLSWRSCGRRPKTI